MKAVIEIPKFLEHLPTHGGYPVPFSQAWVDGVPDFRAVDPEKWLRCVTEHLCAICGKRLGEYCYFIGGERSRESHLFFDPPMHGDCADFASQVCPFVSGKRSEYSNRTVDETMLRQHSLMHPDRPSAMYILRTYTKRCKAGVMDGNNVIQAGSWIGVKEVSA